MKKSGIITAIIVGIILLFAEKLIFGKKDSGEKSNKRSGGLRKATGRAATQEDIDKGLEAVLNAFGRETAQNVERIYRWETAHFTTDQFKRTYTPGMHPAKGADGKYIEEFPFGWGTALKSFVSAYPQYAGNFSLVDYQEAGTGKIKPYIKFPTPEGAFMFLGYLMKNYRGNNRGSWYSTDTAAQNRYNTKTAQVTTPIVNSIA